MNQLGVIEVEGSVRSFLRELGIKTKKETSKVLGGVDNA